MTLRIGIDPGAAGAVVIYNSGRDQPVAWGLMPTVKVGKANRVNGAALAEIIKAHLPAHAYVELVGAMPGQGVVSMFNFGHSAGTLMGVLAALGVPHTMVPPATWKKRAGLVGQDKDAARSRAIQLWPAWVDLALIGKGQALADAALIARYGEEGAKLDEPRHIPRRRKFAL